jgi:hypothetical protein
MTERRASDPSVTVRIQPELLAWLDEESDRRVVGRRLLIETGIRLLRDALRVAPDLVDLPPPPRPPGDPPT